MRLRGSTRSESDWGVIESQQKHWNLSFVSLNFGGRGSPSKLVGFAILNERLNRLGGAIKLQLGRVVNLLVG